MTPPYGRYTTKLKNNIRRYAIIVNISNFVLFTLTILMQQRNYVDYWIWRDILWFFVIYASVQILLIILFKDDYFLSLLTSLEFIALLVMIPFIKYGLLIYGAHDAAAHYSFAQWIINKGFVRIDDPIKYAKTYGNHPGNGLMPAVLSLCTGVNLHFTMTFLLVIYNILPFLTILHIYKHSRILIHRKKYHSTNALSALLIAAMTIIYYWYGSTAFTTALISIIYMFIVKNLLLKSHQRTRINLSYIIVIIISTLGLTLYHSIAIWEAIYIYILPLIPLMLVRFRKSKAFSYLFSVHIIILIITISFSIYMDMHVFGNLIDTIINSIVNPLPREVTAVQKGIFQGILFIDTIKIIISYYCKYIIIFGVSIYFSFWISKQNTYKPFKYYMFLSTFSIYILTMFFIFIIPKTIESITRTARLLQFIVVPCTPMLLIRIIKKARYVLIVLVMVLLIVNYPLSPLLPIVKKDGIYCEPSSKTFVTTIQTIIISHFIKEYTVSNVKIIFDRDLFSFGEIDLVHREYREVTEIDISFLKESVFPIILSESVLDIGEGCSASLRLRLMKYSTKINIVYNNGGSALFYIG